MGTGKSVLLLFLSQWNPKNLQKHEFHCTLNGQDAILEGTYTNQVPAQYLLRFAKEQGNPISKVICIVSRKVKESKANETESFYEEYKNYIQTYCREELQYNSDQVIDFCPIFYDFKQEEETCKISAEDRARYVYQQIVFALKQEDVGQKANVYVDYTGGMRDISFLMVTIIRYLEFDNNISCRKIVYGLMEKDEQNIEHNSIVDLQNVYDMFQIINGISEFVSTGNALQLQQMYHKNGVKNQDSERTQKAIESIINFSNVISLCDMRGLEHAVQNMDASLKKLKEPETDKDFFEHIFYSMVPNIREKMYLNEGMVQKGKVNYPLLIKWCTENRMLQQAITIYVEKMPVYFVENRILPEEILEPYRKPNSVEIDTNLIVPPPGHSWQYKLVDTELFSLFAKGEMEEQKREDEDVEQILTTIIEVDKMISSELQKLKGRPADFLRYWKKEWAKKNIHLDRLFTMAHKLFIKNEKVQIYDTEIKLTGILALYKEMVKPSGAYSRKIIHYALYNDQDEYMKVYGKKGKNAQYSEKLIGILKMDQLIEDGKVEESLQKRMMYFLVIKMIRNHINHASDKDWTDAEKNTLVELKKRGILEDTSYGCIYKTLMSAANYEL